MGATSLILAQRHTIENATFNGDPTTPWGLCDYTKNTNTIPDLKKNIEVEYLSFQFNLGDGPLNEEQEK